MKTKVLLLFAITLSILAVGCGEPVDRQMPLPENNYTLTISSEVQGRLKSFMKIPKQEMKLTVEIDSSGSGKDYHYKAELDVDFFKSKKIDAGRAYNSYGPGIEVVILDEDKQRIMHLNCSKSREEIATMMRQAQGLTKIPFAGSSALFLSFQGDDTKDDLNQAYTFLYKLEQASEGIVTSEIIAKKEEPKLSSSSSTNSSSSSNSEDCDEFLAGYKKYVEDYVKILKEQQKNPSDVTIAAKAAKLAMEANKWAAKVEGCNSDPAFAAKYMQIQLELTNTLSK